MDLQFSSKLQTHLQKLGRENGFAPPKSQDPADAILHEYFVAETARSLFDKRRKIALEALKRLDTKGVIAKGLADAEKGTTGTHALQDTENYTSQVSFKTPSVSVDITAMQNELKRLGVADDIIMKALLRAKKTAKPAESYSVAVKTT